AVLTLAVPETATTCGPFVDLAAESPPRASAPAPARTITPIRPTAIQPFMGSPPSLGPRLDATPGLGGSRDYNRHRAGSSVWLEQGAFNPRVAGSHPARPTKLAGR